MTFKFKLNKKFIIMSQHFFIYYICNLKIWKCPGPLDL